MLRLTHARGRLGLGLWLDESLNRLNRGWKPAHLVHALDVVQYLPLLLRAWRQRQDRHGHNYAVLDGKFPTEPLESLAQAAKSRR